MYNELITVRCKHLDIKYPKRRFVGYFGSNCLNRKSNFNCVSIFNMYGWFECDNFKVDWITFLMYGEHLILIDEETNLDIGG